MAGTTLLLACVLTGCGGGGGDDAPPPNVPPTAGPAASGNTGSPPAGPSTPKSGSSAIRFELAAAADTSAAIYNTADGTLVRTLWRGEARAAGPHQAAWDLRDDAGQKVGDGSYEVRVLVHRVRHVWEGVLGNTSASAPWDELHKSYWVPTSLVAQPKGMLYAVGYNEGQSSIGGFDLDRPQRNRSAVRHVDPFASVAMLAADDDRVYWVNGGGISRTTFVGVFDARNGKQAAFSEGSVLCLNRMTDGNCYPDQSYRSVIGLRTAEGERATGIAVQKTGALLAVAWAADGRVQLFDKLSGRLQRSIVLPLQAGAANQLAMTPAGDLWVLGPQTATRYTSLATNPTVAAQITGLARPLAVTVDPRDEDAVWIADGGASQQVKRHDRWGALRATLGQPGGMRDRSELADDRYCFYTARDQEGTALAVAADGALWAVDACNVRLVRLGDDGRIAASVAWLPANYVAAVDPANPGRVFAGFIEYAVDGGRPVDQPGAWRMVRNWLGTLPASLRDAHAHNGHWGGLRLVRTLANGRTYAVIAAHGRQQLVELGADGRLRAIGPLPRAAASATEPYLYENGDLGDAVVDGTRQIVRRWRLAGFDAFGDPRWSALPETIAVAPIGARTPHFRLGAFSGIAPPRFPLTASDKVVFFDPSVTGNEGFHLGAVARGGSTWAWQASPSGPMDGRGTFQTKAIDGSLHYGGNVVMSEGASIVYGYHGEFYKDLANGRTGQANQFMHFHENGQFIGQFGMPSTRSSAAVEPGRSGNAFSPTLVRHAGRTYLYHNDESTFGGVHRWRIDGLDGVVELRGTGTAGWPITAR